MTKYGYKLVFPHQKELINAGFGKVAHIPSIFDSEPGYSRLPSRFLIDRALGSWDPALRGVSPNPRPPSRISIKNFGYWLCNALEWAEARSIDLMTCDYSNDLVGRYQMEMLKGIWSQRGEPLAAATVNARVEIALEFQLWCADKGLRRPFQIPTTTRSIIPGTHASSAGHAFKTVEARKGKVKENKLKLVFPADHEIRLWRGAVHAQPMVGKTHGLMVDHILGTAIRREELACWRIDTLPLDPRDWKIVNPQQPEEAQQVSISISNGTKGRQFYIDEYGDKVGPQGEIKMPLWLCKKIHEYRNNERILALKNITRGIRSRTTSRELIEKTVHLYIHPATGKRYNGDQIYQLWTKVKGPDNWSPHRGRDWWACKYLWEKMQEHALLLKQVNSITTGGNYDPLFRALKNTALDVIHLEIRPQLRHSSSATTEIYLAWLFNQLRVPLNLTLLWNEEDEENVQ